MRLQASRNTPGSCSHSAASGIRSGTTAPSPERSPKPFTNPKIAGITISVSSVDEIMPPIMGTAMRCMISDPVPLLHMIGSRPAMIRSEEHTSELQSRGHLVCRLLLEEKKQIIYYNYLLEKNTKKIIV